MSLTKVPPSMIEQTGNQSPVAGSKMKIDYLFEDGAYPLENEGGVWSAGTYTYFGVSKEITNSTVPDQGNGTLTGGPVTAFFSFANNNGAGGDVVAILGDSVARTSNGTVFGANFIARNDGGTTNTKLVGVEIDVEPAIGTTMGAGSGGLFFNIFSIASTAPVCLVGGVGGGTWGNGFITSHITGAHFSVLVSDPTTAVSFIDTRNGTFSQAAIQLGNSAAQGISFGAGLFDDVPFIYSETFGDLVLKSGTSNNVPIKSGAGVTKIVLSAGSTPSLSMNGSQIITIRDTGFSAMTGSIDKSTIFNTSTVTTSQLAERVAALQSALTGHGLIGA